MTFDQWIDSVNARVRSRLGDSVRTQELSWDSAWWTGGGKSVAATMSDDGFHANISSDGGDRVSVAFREPAGDAGLVGDYIADRLAAR